MQKTSDLAVTDMYSSHMRAPQPEEGTFLQQQGRKRNGKRELAQVY